MIGLNVGRVGILIVGLLIACLAQADASRRTLLIVAHQDDDVGMIADLKDRFDAREAINTVYLTGGDAAENCSTYVQERETGVKAMYAYWSGLPANTGTCSTAGQTNCWSPATKTVAGKIVRTHDLRGTGVRLSFMGFLNPRADDLAAASGNTLERLWSVQGSTITTLTLDSRTVSDTYTKQALIDALLAIVVDFKPTDVQTLDPNRSYPALAPFDHTDHVHTAFFASAALQLYAVPTSFTYHRGYNILLEPKNLVPPNARLARRQELRGVYQPFDRKICTTATVQICPGIDSQCFDPALFDELETRAYTNYPVLATDRQIQSSSGSCLDVIGNNVYVAPCFSLFAAQHWDMQASGQIRNRDRGTCMSSTDGVNVSLATCNSALASQRFQLQTNNQLKGPNAQCLTQASATVHLEMCDINTSQVGFKLH